MTNLVYKDFNIDVASNQYVDIGKMCAIHNKKLNDWTRTKSGKAYLQALVSSTYISAVDLITTNIGGKAGSKTFAHPLVAIEVARWISPEFGIWCNTHINQLITTGSTTTDEEAKARALILKHLRNSCDALRSKYDGFLLSKDADDPVKREDWIYLMETMLTLQQQREDYLHQHGAAKYWKHYEGKGIFHITRDLYNIIGNTKELVTLVNAR